jgi:hypothetical protein
VNIFVAMKDSMDVLNNRLNLIRTAVFTEKNNVQSNSEGKNINYHRRALYSDIELLKMELEECLSHISDANDYVVDTAESKCNTENTNGHNHNDNRNSYNDADNSTSSDRDSLLKSSVTAGYVY